MTKGLNKLNIQALELFSGIGGFRIALDQAGIETIWANDIDKIACEVYRDDFGDKEIVEGDIWKLIEKTPSHNLLTAGFPCQPFSSAGKKRGIEDPRGTLFAAIVKILEKHQPDYFILENVKRLLLMDEGKHFATILDALASLDYRIEWRVLNAADFALPQNRQRIFITGTHHRVLNSAGMKCDDENAIKLATDEDLDRISDFKKSIIQNSDEWKSIVDHGRFKNWGIACGGKYVTEQLHTFSSSYKPVSLAQVLEKSPHPRFDLTESTLDRLTSNRHVRKMIAGVEVVSNQSGGARMGYTIYGINGIAPTLTSSTSRHYERYFINDRYRRLSNIEYARIQGFPDNHCKSATLRDQYVLYGNAVPPNMVHWVVEQLTKPYDMNNIKLTERQLALYA